MTQIVPTESALIEIAITLPVDVLHRLQNLVDMGIVNSQNAFFAAAIEQYLAKLESEEIDRQFATLADDEIYQQMIVSLATEFAISDWETLNIELTYDKYD